MHEWALAEAVVAKAAEVARARDLARVVEVVVGLGELQDVDREALAFGLAAAQRSVPGLEEARFAFEVEQARCSCRPCGHAWALRESLDALPEEDRESIHLLPEVVHLYVACPSCGSPDFAIVGGRGVSLLAVDG
ncbi:MAG: hydrogenase nickel incorporation protein HypA [Chloroflexi bacterium]|nr:hydrogenase nickel incorporation protein HypA [Chloroflexota bacterium]